MALVPIPNCNYATQDGYYFINASSEEPFGAYCSFDADGNAWMDFMHQNTDYTPDSDAAGEYYNGFFGIPYKLSDDQINAVIGTNGTFGHSYRVHGHEEWTDLNYYMMTAAVSIILFRFLSTCLLCGVVCWDCWTDKIVPLKLKPKLWTLVFVFVSASACACGVDNCDGLSTVKALTVNWFWLRVNGLAGSNWVALDCFAVNMRLCGKIVRGGEGGADRSFDELQDGIREKNVGKV